MRIATLTTTQRSCLWALLLATASIRSAEAAFTSSARHPAAVVGGSASSPLLPSRPAASLAFFRQVVLPQDNKHRSSSALQLAFSDDDNDDDRNDDNRNEDKNNRDSNQPNAGFLHNTLRTDIRIFLTQRALQSFLFLLAECRDPHTVKWLEDTYEFKNLHYFHGTGGLNVTKYPAWNTILNDMAHRPSDVVIVSVRRRGRGHGGWSKDNPHIEDRFVEFEIDIDPPSLVSRIVSVRDQIANEWINDLNTLVVANEMILDSYHEKIAAARKAEDAAARGDKAEQDKLFAALDDFSKGQLQEEQRQQQQSTTGSVENKKDDHDDSEEEDYMSIESLTAPYKDKNDDDASVNVAGLGGGSSSQSNNAPNTALSQSYTRSAVAFDRNAMMYMSNQLASNDVGPSPFRSGNFDLLILLATQEAVHRVLRTYRDAGEEREVSYAWLREFYVKRVSSYFDGHQSLYGRADDFLEELLLTPPSMRDIASVKSVSGKKQVGLIDPLRIAEDIIQMRSKVAKEWKGIMQIVPNEHMDLQRTLLAIRMGNYNKQEEQAKKEKLAVEQEVGKLSSGGSFLEAEGSFE